jgi:hypothetical protein
MDKKEAFKKRPVVLGIDETNNGFGLNCYNPNFKSSQLVTLYIGDNSERPLDYEGSRFESKGGTFNDRRDVERAIARGRHYLHENPSFFYTTIPKEAVQTTPIEILKANAIALLTFKYVLRYNPQISNVQLIIDQMDGKESSKTIGKIVEIWLKKTGLDIPYRFIQHAEGNFIPVRKADRVGYWLTAIHFLGENPKWPYRHRRVNLNALEKLALEVIETNNPGI